MAVGRHLEEDFEVPSDKETKSVTEKKESVENPGFLMETKPKSLVNVNEERPDVKENAFIVTSNKKEYDDIKSLNKPAPMSNDTSGKHTWIICQRRGSLTDFVQGRREESDKSHMCASTVHSCSRSQMRLPLHHERLKAEHRLKPKDNQEG
ncbi:PREDICTED: uncharacterized protein LOC104798392 [Tarenaya hassleriana]|uniref:uncharacterized protein LOC104798392 n=1 Tax=Tarenaya hassleriana TaxID=28532 RepID=UPI00053C188A|nr:PREDICTED: uncharacterized protein LOC104798392 [Tarenaya hassleriana]